MPSCSVGCKRGGQKRQDASALSQYGFAVKGSGKPLARQRSANFQSCRGDSRPALLRRAVERFFVSAEKITQYFQSQALLALLVRGGHDSPSKTPFPRCPRYCAIFAGHAHEHTPSQNRPFPCQRENSYFREFLWRQSPALRCVSDDRRKNSLSYRQTKTHDIFFIRSEPNGA